MTLTLLLLSCGGSPEVGLSAEGKAAQAQLAAALESRDVAQVSSAARAAGAFRGEDPALDRMLGDALANVLMHPDQGLALLKTNPAPDDPAWRAALRGAAVRLGDQAEMDAAWAATGGPEIHFLRGIADIAAARARRDPNFDLNALEEVNADCDLMIKRPTLGRASLNAPARASLIPAVRALGATEIVLARPSLPSDPDPLLGAPGLWRCGEWTLLEGDAYPEDMPARMLVLGAYDGKDRVYIEARMEEGQPWVFNTSVGDWGARWIRAADLYDAEGGGEAGVNKVRSVLGVGLAGTAFPKEGG